MDSPEGCTKNAWLRPAMASATTAERRALAPTTTIESWSIKPRTLRCAARSGTGIRVSSSVRTSKVLMVPPAERTMIKESAEPAQSAGSAGSAELVKHADMRWVRGEVRGTGEGLGTDDAAGSEPAGKR